MDYRYAVFGVTITQTYEKFIYPSDSAGIQTVSFLCHAWRNLQIRKPQAEAIVKFSKWPVFPKVAFVDLGVSGSFISCFHTLGAM